MTGAPPQRGVLALGGALAGALVLGVAVAGPGDTRALLVVGLGLGLGATLAATNFGFAGAFKQLVEERDPVGLRAHFVAIGVAMVLMVPMIAAGSVLGTEVHGVSRGVGVASLIGGLLFGVGMQLAAGCASGTLYQLGSGAQRHVGTLLGFVTGSVLAATHLDRWWALGGLPPVTLLSGGPWPLWLALELGVLVLLFRVLPGSRPPRHKLVGAVLLGVLGAAVLVVTRWPWSETWGFTLWGAQLVAPLGAHPETWPAFAHSRYDVSPLVDRASIVDLAIPIGAMLATAAAGRFRWTSASPRAWLAAVVGGTLMGYGARIAGGCNIGAYFSALASGDLSGWAWAAAATLGTALGLHARGRLGLRANAAGAAAVPRVLELERDA